MFGSGRGGSSVVCPICRGGSGFERGGERGERESVKMEMVKKERERKEGEKKQERKCSEWERKRG